MMQFPCVGGKSLCKWNEEWECIGILQNVVDRKIAPRKVGLYRTRCNCDVVYVGVASEHENGGLRKRLSDYVRSSDSARKNAAGKKINTHANVLEIDVLVTGSDSCAADVARRLESGFIFLYQPPWNFLARAR